MSAHHKRVLPDMVVSCHVDAGIELGTCARAVSALKPLSHLSSSSNWFLKSKTKSWDQRSCPLMKTK